MTRFLSLEYQDVTWSLLDHNWLRALKMASYGFLLYGPGSYVWYQYLDRWMPQQTPQNVLIKVKACSVEPDYTWFIIAFIFAWNNLWQGKLSKLPNKYEKDALRTLLFGALCDAVLLANLRLEHWSVVPVKQRKKNIYVLTRNLRLTAYTLAIASIVLEDQGKQFRLNRVVAAPVSNKPL
ncbi:protein Mpv17 [Tanacetum coccineum]